MAATVVFSFFFTPFCPWVDCGGGLRAQAAAGKNQIVSFPIFFVNSFLRVCRFTLATPKTRKKEEWRVLHSHVCTRHRQTPVEEHDEKTRHVDCHVAQPSYSALQLEIGDFCTSVIRCVAYALRSFWDSATPRFAVDVRGFARFCPPPITQLASGRRRVVCAPANVKDQVPS